MHKLTLIFHFEAMQIQYNMTRIEEWCKSHEMPEGTLQLEHLMQATKLLQLKKVNHVFVHAILASFINPMLITVKIRHR